MFTLQRNRDLRFSLYSSSTAQAGRFHSRFLGQVVWKQIPALLIYRRYVCPAHQLWTELIFFRPGEPGKGRMSQLLMKTERDLGATISFEPRKKIIPRTFKIDAACSTDRVCLWQETTTVTRTLLPGFPLNRLPYPKKWTLVQLYLTWTVVFCRTRNTSTIQLILQV